MGPLVYANHEHPVGDGNRDPDAHVDAVEEFLPHRGDIALLHWRGHVRVVQTLNFRVVGTSILVGVPNVTDAVALFSRKSSKVL